LQQVTLEHAGLSLTLETSGAGLSLKQDLGQGKHQTWPYVTVPTFLALALSVICDTANVLHHMWGRRFFLSVTINSLVLCKGKHLEELSTLILPGTRRSASSNVLGVSE